MDREPGVDRAGEQLRTAHVDADRAPARHAVTIWGDAERLGTAPIQGLPRGAARSESPPPGRGRRARAGAGIPALPGRTGRSPAGVRALDHLEAGGARAGARAGRLAAA